MARKIRQIRYYGEGLNSKNYPSDVNMSKLITGTAFKNNNQYLLYPLSFNSQGSVLHSFILDF